MNKVKKEAGRAGGSETFKRYGSEYMRELALKGAATGKSGRPRLKTLEEIRKEKKDESRTGRTKTHV